MMIICRKAVPKFRMPSMAFSQLALGEFDYSNIIQAVKPASDIAAIDIMTKLNSISPSELYIQLDVFSRDALLYLANDLGWGMGAAILSISLGIKLLFAPLMISTQLNGIKTKLLEPEMKNYQANVQRLSKQQDFQQLRQCQQQFRTLRRKHGISSLLPLLSLSQIPILMTWFFSLRYVASLPDKFPGIRTEGFLWFKDLSSYDPYGVLPLLSATLTFMNMSLNPNLQAGSGTFFARYYRFVRFIPFASIPIVLFFPSAINLYWCSSALVHLLIASAARSEDLRKYAGIPKYLPGTILERMSQGKTSSIIKGVIEETMKQKEGMTMGKVAEEATQKISGGTVKIFSQKPKKK